MRKLTLQDAILGSANYAMISGTKEGIVTIFNATAERWLGYTAVEVVGKLTPAIWHDADEVVARAKVLSRELGRRIEPGFETFVAKAALGQIDENEWTFIRKDGSRFPVLLSITALVDEVGTITGFLGVVADITEGKRTTTVLLESKHFLRSTLDALSSHIAILDEHGTIIEVNAAWNHFAFRNTFMGSNPGVGDNYLQVCDSASGRFSEEAPVVASGIRAIMTGQSDEFHLEYPCHGPQEQRWFIVRATRFDAGRAIRVVVAHENITERKKLEVEREKLIGELQQALAEVKTLSGMIPICGWCKKIRSDQGYWQSVEQYVGTHTDATFSHGMCPECSEKFKDDIFKANDKEVA